MGEQQECWLWVRHHLVLLGPVVGLHCFVTLPTMTIQCYDVTYRVDSRTPENKVPVLAQDLVSAIESVLRVLPIERHQIKHVAPRYIGY